MVDFVFTFPQIINTIVKWEVSSQLVLAASCAKKQRQIIQSRHRKTIKLLLIKSLPWYCDHDPGNSNFLYDPKIIISKILWSYNHDPWSRDHDPDTCWVEHDPWGIIMNSYLYV